MVFFNISIEDIYDSNLPNLIVTIKKYKINNFKKKCTVIEKLYG